MWLRYRNNSTGTTLRAEHRFLAGQKIFSLPTVQTDLRHTSAPYPVVNRESIAEGKVVGTSRWPFTSV